MNKIKNLKNYDKRPWGEYFVINSSNDFKIKKIVVSINERLSYQYHEGRSETWVIIQGKAQVTINDEIFYKEKGDTIVIPKKAKHRIQNISSNELIFIEVQTGDYFDEDDIVRIEDDYNRV